MGFKASVDNNVCGDARVEMDTDDDFNDEAYDDYIPSNRDGFEFYNKIKDEWIDNLQVDFNDEAYDDYIPSNRDGFEFYNKVKDERIDNLQVDFLLVKH